MCSPSQRQHTRPFYRVDCTVTHAMAHLDQSRPLPCSCGLLGRRPPLRGAGVQQRRRGRQSGHRNVHRPRRRASVGPVSTVAPRARSYSKHAACAYTRRPIAPLHARVTHAVLACACVVRARRFIANYGPTNKLLPVPPLLFVCLFVLFCLFARLKKVHARERVHQRGPGQHAAVQGPRRWAPVHGAGLRQERQGEP